MAHGWRIGGKGALSPPILRDKPASGWNEKASCHRRGLF